MDTYFEDLAERFEEEAARQAIELDLCRAQLRAIRAGDLEYVEAKAADIQQVRREAINAARARDELVGAIAAGLGAPREELTVSVLADHAPLALGGRLRVCAEQIERVQDEIRHVALSGVLSLQRAAAAVLAGMEAFQACVHLAPEASTAPGVVSQHPDPTHALS